MVKQNKIARVRYIEDFHIGCSDKEVKGYLLELWDDELQEYCLATFAQVAEDSHISDAFLKVIAKTANCGYDIKWLI